MTRSADTIWKEQFGVSSRRPSVFFTPQDDLSRYAPQAHLLRRGFEDLLLGGVLCADNAPLVYFRCLNDIAPETVRDLQRRFWHHGGAPVLVLISKDEVHVYSGLTLPAIGDEPASRPPSLVTTLERVGDDLPGLLTSIESGEFFRANRKYFNPAHRVDRELLSNLRDTRKEMDDLSQRAIPAEVLDALLCRLVFTCYLFDRGVIGESYLNSLGISGASHLRDVLAIQPTGEAKAALYRLFEQLGEDFNGDLFSDDLAAESCLIVNKHLETLADFFRGTSVKTGQRAFWPYDFGIIPIETISAIYERFLRADERTRGAFYTPRFLAEVVLDVALSGTRSLTGKRFLDPACGSGIFLVGLFNRLAEEWRASHPKARNDRKSRELMQIVQESLFGVDVNLTACRITAFSLCLAFLDQLPLRDIQQLQEKEKVLPKLIADRDGGGNIFCADFFSDDVEFPTEMSVVVGNPPWGSSADDNTPAGLWCSKHEVTLPDKQIAAAFIEKATHHVENKGQVCFVLPHGVLFNHGPNAIAFQKEWVAGHAIEQVLNLADYQRFLFEEAGHPAVVVRYRKRPPKDNQQRIEYWSPKSDWTVTNAEVIAIAPQDRTQVVLKELLESLGGLDAPTIWKERYWATPRDWRLLDRLSDLPRLRDQVRQPKDGDSEKPWLMAEGFQPVGPSDDPSRATELELPSRDFIAARSRAIDLVLLPRDCEELPEAKVTVRSGSNKTTRVFESPHVLLTKGFRRAAYAAFPVSFRHALRGINGPEEDHKLLAFLAAYLRSSLARYYLFHTSSNWGVSRQEVHVKEVLRLPFPLPAEHPEPERATQLVDDVDGVVASIATELDRDLVERDSVVASGTQRIEELVFEYFDIHPMERDLIHDTIDVSIPSARPTRARLVVPTVMNSTDDQRERYCARVCEMLNGWSRRGQSGVRGQVLGAEKLGVGVAVFEKVKRNEIDQPMDKVDVGFAEGLARLRRLASSKQAAIDFVRGVKVFDKNRLYVVKPLARRNWTLTAAMNDADEIAGTILMQSAEASA